MVIFVDTSALYALLDAGDQNHESAKTVWARWLDQPVGFGSSNYVLLESVSLVQHRLGMVAVRRFLDDLTPLLHVHWVTPEVHAAAMSALLAAGRRDLSLVDCTSLELMHRLDMRVVFAFDRRFADQGFTCLP